MKWLMRCLYLQFRILTLTATKEELLSLDTDAFIWGLATVWIAGLGRYWDAPAETLLMRSGFPSVVYIFVLAAFLWLFIWVLSPKNWSYMRLVTFISMTGMPAFLYAIPFEKMYGIERGAECNAVVLAVVASWRVLMLGNYLVRVTKLNILSVTSALLLPLMTIVTVLMGVHQLEHVVEVMGGYRLRHVVQIDEKEAIAKYLSEKSNGSDPFDTASQSEVTSQNGSLGTANQNLVGTANPNEVVTEYPKQKPIIVMVDGKPIEFVSAVFHTFRGRNHIVYLQEDAHPIPPGFKEVKSNDPEYSPMHPMLAIAYPVAQFCSDGLIPVFVVYFCSIFYGLGTRSKND